MTQPVRVAVVQHCARTEVNENMQTLDVLSRQAADDGARVICWPEAFAYIGPHAGKLKILEPLPEGGAILERARALARDLGVQLLLGGFHESDPADRGRCYNTSVYLDQDGEVLATYRKIHLFDIAMRNGPQLMESTHTSPGRTITVVETLMGILGLSVCYDLRYPELYQTLVDRGATVLSVPSAFTATTGAAHWHALLRARAIENQSYVLAPAQHGQHNETRQSFGHSVIIDPWGTILAELDQGDGFVCADLDPALVATVREQLPSLANRRPFE